MINEDNKIEFVLHFLWVKCASHREINQNSCNDLLEAKFFDWTSLETETFFSANKWSANILN